MRRRSYAADDVFDALARDILLGRIPPGEPLPPERALSERFEVSKLLVRQAVHRLADAGLVRVRQGDVTRALDPATSYSLAKIDLYYRLAPESDVTARITHAVLEKQYTQGLSLVEVFARRASAQAKRALVTLVTPDAAASDDAFARFEERFWTHVARGGQNAILEAEVGFWYRELAARPTMPNAPPRETRLAFYAELARRLATDEGPVAWYVATLSPSITALFTHTT